MKATFKTTITDKSNLDLYQNIHCLVFKSATVEWEFSVTGGEHAPVLNIDIKRVTVELINEDDMLEGWPLGESREIVAEKTEMENDCWSSTVCPFSVEYYYNSKIANVIF